MNLTTVARKGVKKILNIKISTHLLCTSYLHKTIIKETSHKINKIKQKSCNKIVIIFYFLSFTTGSKGKSGKKIICDLCNRKKCKKIYNKGSGGEL